MNDTIKIMNICYKYLNRFSTLKPKDKNGNDLPVINPMPENDKMVTVFFKNETEGGKVEEGFLVNVCSRELAYSMEFGDVEKWILHSKLEKLAGCSLT